MTLTPFKLVSFLALSSISVAQVFTPPPARNQAAAPQNQAVTQNQSQNQQSPFGQEIPLLDPSAESIKIGGFTIPIGDNRIVRARFEKYLNQPAEISEESDLYREKVKGILDGLSPSSRVSLDPVDAYRLLNEAADYSGDGGRCESLSFAIYSARQSHSNSKSLRRYNDVLDEQASRLQKDIDWSVKHDKPAPLDGKQTSNADRDRGRDSKKETAGVGRSSEITQGKKRRLEEIQILRKANSVKSEASRVTSKAQYQYNMVQLFAERRFMHVLLASRFYHKIWTDGDSALRLKKNSEILKGMERSLGISPTVSMLDNLSSEALRDTEKAIAGFHYLLDQKELHQASRRLMEAFMIGEFLEPLSTLPLIEKRKVQRYSSRLFELYDVMNARDYTKAKALVEELKELATDFPSAKADSAITAYTLQSDLSVERAKSLMLRGSEDRAAEEIRKATETWPTNPKLNEIRDLMSQGNEIVRAQNDFDRLLGEQNFREIFNRRAEFIVAAKGDSERERAFNEIMTNVSEIDFSLKAAQQFVNAGNPYAAWEQLSVVREKFPEDSKLGREIEKLTAEVASFTQTLNNAKDFEERTPIQMGSALSLYYKAKHIYPQSKYASEGIDRLIKKVLPR